MANAPRSAPIPEAWKKDAEIRATYYDALDGASEPFKVKHAKPALEKCLKLSVQHQYFDEFSRACEVWLAKNYKAEYHVVDELRTAPTLSNSGLDDRPPPLMVGGTMWHPPAAEAPAAKTPTTSSDDGQQSVKSGGGAKPAGGGAKPRGGAKPKGRR